MTVTESFTRTVRTVVAAEVTPTTSYATLESSAPEVWSSKNCVGMRTRRANIASRKSSTTRLATHAIAYVETRLRKPRTTKMAMIAKAKSDGGSDADLPAANPPSSMGFISTGKSGSVAAVPTIASSASAKTPAYGRTYESSRTYSSRLDAVLMPERGPAPRTVQSAFSP